MELFPPSLPPVDDTPQTEETPTTQPLVEELSEIEQNNPAEAEAPEETSSKNARRSKPARPSKKPTRPVEAALFSISTVLMVCLALFLLAIIAVGKIAYDFITPSAPSTSPPGGSFSVVQVVGTIQNSTGNALGINEPTYQHGSTVEYIKQLTDNPNDKGILLYMDTGGGGVYESDEVYRALMNYKEKTGRPIYAYMASTCASGGYYICMAADYIISNYNTTTGSIGVYMTLSDKSGLYEKLGIETILIRSGDNKGVGTSGVEITPSQREVFQSVVDESYNRFVTLVAQGRNLPENVVRPLADGRIYTANQALKNSLVDELGDWDYALEVFREKSGGTEFYPNFSQTTLLGTLLGNLPKNEMQILQEKVEELPSGVPLAYAPGLLQP